jgi:hypothetical protein
MTRFFRSIPELEALEERLALDASVSISAGTTVWIDVDNDSVIDHALQVVDGNIELHYELTGSWDGGTHTLTLLGGLAISTRFWSPRVGRAVRI